ncbi:hypothetical protein ACIP2X_06245 [Streptomyces sp. NPDC089424]|uniref:hypothetical protein n=1 Tax=Streptomyces sp. NPDC089424 TaxID=3365917 RepID=UPI00382CB4A6
MREGGRGVRVCWFCGDVAPPSWHDRVLGLHQGVDTTMTPWIVVLRTTWRQEVVHVPRCARCHTGHQIERTAAALSVAALIAYAASGELDQLLGILPASTGERTVAAIWAAVACLPGLTWIALRHAWLPWRRLAPRRLGHARHHPEFQRLLEEDWKARPGPFPYWANPPSPHPPPSPGRFRRVIGRLIDLVGTACGIGIPVAYFQGYEELAGVLIAATAGLFFLSSKVRPES